MKPAYIFRILILAIFSLTAFTLHSQKSNINYTQVLKPLNADDTIVMAKECLERRLYLSGKLRNGVIVINNNDKTSDNFFYLTGWNGNPAYCLIDVANKESFTLLIPDPNPQSIIWNGKQPGKAEAQKLGANSQHLFEFKKQMQALLKTDKKLYLLNQDKVLKEDLKGILLTRADSDKIVYIDTIVHEMRIFKTRYEVENIKKAIGVTANALNNAIRTTKPNIYEYEIGALFSFEYTRNGVKEAFTSICGSGINSTALHYETNNKLMQPGDVLLMDVGAEYNGYAADITRTIPVNGKFTRAQLDLYKLVLKAQEEGIKIMKPGNKILDFHNRCTEIILRGLYELGLMTDTTKQWQKNVFILYQSGHYLGLYVHDVGRYESNFGIRSDKRGRDLLPGMIITIEPGIYINPDMLKFIYDINGNTVPKDELDAFVTKVTPAFAKYANIGIRIEDDILITTNGNEILSGAIPKQPEDIERLMNKK